MPWFGKKKTQEKLKAPPTPGSYPIQNTGPSYPVQQPTQGVGFANSSEAPPPYTPQMTPWPPSPHGGQPAHASQHQSQFATMPPTQYGMQGQQPPPFGASTSTVIVPDGFDAGARFDVVNPSMPPPPPGCMPTAGQMAAAQGQNVVVTQKKGSFWTGGSDGGMTFW